MPSQSAKAPVERQVSAGGLVVRRSDHGPEVALISVGSPPRWQLPKGLVDKGESPESAAIREVREEAGIDAEIVAPLKTIEYWYQASRGGSRVRYHKFVHFFLMHYVSGDVAEHDHEVNEAKWLTVSDAHTLLAFRSEREVLSLAAERLQ